MSSDLLDRMQGYENWQRREAASLRAYSTSPSMPELAEMHEETADALKDARAEIERLREVVTKIASQSTSTPSKMIIEYARAAIVQSHMRSNND